MSRFAYLAVSLACGAVLSVLLRQDANWDLQNYHLYNGWAVLTGRWRSDLFVSGIQSYLNPLLDVPHALAALVWLPGWPRTVAALAGLPMGLLLWLVCRASLTAARQIGAGPWVAAWMAVIGLSGSTVAAEIGTTFNDIPIACLVVAAVWLLLHAASEEISVLRAAALAGALLGAAVGLKITTLVLGPAGLVAVLLLARWRWLAAGSAYVAAWLAGAMAVEGWWAWQLYQRFGNPVFPLLNDMFGSDWHAAASEQDLRFLPHSVLQAVFFPFTWLARQRFVVSEIETGDARFALAWMAMPVLGWLGWRGRLPRGGAAVAGFVLAGFAAWEAAFGIIRYIVPLEALIGIPLGLAVWCALPRRRSWVLGGIALLLAATTNYPGYGRVRGWRGFVPEAAVAPGALLVVAGKPLSFLVPAIAGPSNDAVGLEDVVAGTRLDLAVRDRIRAAGVIEALLNGPDSEAALHRFGLATLPGGCRALANPFRPGVTLCRVARF